MWRLIAQNPNVEITLVRGDRSMTVRTSAKASPRKPVEPSRIRELDAWTWVSDPLRTMQDQVLETVELAEDDLKFRAFPQGRNSKIRIYGTQSYSGASWSLDRSFLTRVHGRSGPANDQETPPAHWSCAAIRLIEARNAKDLGLR
jgi:hypothetical protein